MADTDEVRFERRAIAWRRPQLAYVEVRMRFIACDGGIDAPDEPRIPAIV